MNAEDLHAGAATALLVCNTSRPVLHQLQPEGVGSATCETLYSYTLRLSRSHRVTLYQLVAFVCRPRPGLFAEALSPPVRLDSLCENVVEFTSRLATLTQVPSVKLVGLSWLHGKTATNEKLKTHLAWCPACVRDSLHAGKSAHGQTSWLFVNVQCCLVHALPLRVSCPRCGTRKDPRTVVEGTLLETCSACGCDLSESCPDGPEQSASVVVNAWDVYAARQIGDLISKAPEIASGPDKPDIARIFRSASERGRAASVSGLGTLAGTGRGIQRFSGANASLPTIDFLLRLAIASDVSLAGVFSPDLWSEDDLQVPFGHADGQERKRRNRMHDWTAIHADVEQRLHAGEDISVDGLSRELDIKSAVLVSKLGDLAHAVTRHRRQILAARHRQEVSELVDRLERLSRTYSYFRRRLSMAEASRELGISKESSLLKNAWREFNEEWSTQNRNLTLFDSLELA